MVARGGEPHVEGWLFATTENLCTARSLSLQGIWEDYTRVASLTINKSLFIIIFFRKIITVIPFVKPSGFVEGWRRQGMELAAKVEIRRPVRLVYHFSSIELMMVVRIIIRRLVVSQSLRVGFSTSSGWLLQVQGSQWIWSYEGIAHIDQGRFKDSTL